MIQMTLPGILLGIVISTLYGALFHLWRGGGVLKLIWFLFCAWVGFWAGNYLGIRNDWQFLNVGTLHLGPATLGNVVCLGLGYWLSLVQYQRHDD
jgi:hypothetical protein